MSNHQALDLHHILAAPLIATIEADYQAANKFIDFVIQHGFESLPDEATPAIAARERHATVPLGKLRMVTFWYSRHHPKTGQEEYDFIQVPALSLIPLPLLQVDRAEFNFHIQVHPEEEVSQPHPQGQRGALNPALRTARESEPPSRPNFKASLPPTRGHKDGELVPTTANMKVNVLMRQADLPTGIANLMAILKEGASMSRHCQVERSPNEPNNPSPVNS